LKTAWTRKSLISFLTLLAAALLASPLMADSDDPPARVARLSYVNGSVSFQPSGEDQWSQASINYPLTTGDRIYTDRDARAELETGNVAVRLSESTDLTTANLTDQLLQLGLAQGTLRVRAFDMVEGNSIEIDTSNASLTLLRPGSYRVETYPDENVTLVYVISGDLEMNANGVAQTIHSGQALKISGNDDVQTDWISPPARDDFDDWNGERDRRYQGGRSRQYVSTYSPGYHDLDEYGRWESESDYGQVWYPTTVSVDWAPYRYGRWVWIEPWGWTWVAQEPWGFTPFHYGRWVLVGSRWGWCPGPVAVRPVYAPALVAFVGGPRAGISVWFPLGPRDPYFPSYHHSDGYLRQVNVTNVTVRNVTVVNNYINVRNERSVTNINYQYQRVAPTAVSSDAFRGSRNVHDSMVHLRPDEVGRGRVISHPEVAPDVRAIRGGTPEVRPPVVSKRPVFEDRGNRQVNREGRPNVGVPPPDQNRNTDRNVGGGRQDNRPGVVVQPPPGQTVKGAADPAGRDRGRDAGRDSGRDSGRDTGNARPDLTTRTPPPTGPVMHGGGQQVPAQVPRTGEPAPGQNNRNADDAASRDRGRDIGSNPGSNPGRNPNSNPGGDPGRDTGRDRPNVTPRTPPPTGQPLHGAGQPVPVTPAPNSGRQVPAQTNPGNREGDNRQWNRDRGRDISGPPTERRPIVTNNPPPPQKPSFEQRQPELKKDPGRPLEPRQVDNMQHGQPAGPPRDREFPGHQTNSRPNTPPPPAQDRGKKPETKPEDKGKDKDKDHNR
jgi:uncharacterized protein DUF6600